MDTPSLRLKLVRENLGLKQKEVAKQLHMLPSSYNQIEAGRNNVSPRVAALMRLIFRVNDKWLMKGVGNMYLSDKDVSISSAGRSKDLQELQSQLSECQGELARCKKIIDALTSKIT